MTINSGTRELAAISDALHELQPDEFIEQLERRLFEARMRSKMLGMESEPVMLGRWELRESIDHGAMGAVYRAFDPKLQRVVALKILLCSDDARLVERTKRMEAEARAMAQLRHPNVVMVHDFQPAEPGRGDGQTIPSFLVMEFVRGTTLLEWQRDTHRGWQEVIDKYLQAARGLAYIHEHSLVHRDIKPNNLLISDSGEVLIGDFGLVHTADSPPEPDEVPAEDPPESAEPSPFSVRLTRQGAVLGTLVYMAPEQLKRGTTTPKSDQYSFFVALFEALHGQRPHAGTTRDALLRSMDSGHSDVAKRRSIPRWLDKLITRGLERAPANRHASMGEVVEAIERGLGQRRRRNMAVLGTVAVLSVMTAGLLYWRLSDDPCVDAGQPITEIWNPETRQRAEQAFASIKSSGARAWSSFESRVERYTTSWLARTNETCEQLAREDTRSNDAIRLARAREACLEGSLGQLAALMRRYEQASVGDVRNSDDASYALDESLRRCDNAELLLAGSPEPAPTGATLQATRVQLDDAWASELGGALEDAYASASAADETARQHERQHLEARAAFRLGRVHTLKREHPQALQHFARAMELANTTHRDDLAADALIELVKVYVLDVEDLKLAASHAALLDGFVARIGGEQRRRLAAAAEVRGMLARASRDREAAINLHREALSIREGAPEDQPIAATDRVRSLVNLANALADPGASKSELDEAKTLYTRALEDAASNLGEIHPIMAETRFNYAVFLDERGEYKTALTESRVALNTTEALYGSESRRAAIVQVLVGKLALYMEDMAGARTATDAALKVFEASERAGEVNSDLISALQLRAEIFKRADDPGAAQRELERALELLRESPDHRLWYADTLSYLGELLLELKRPDDALSHLTEAWAILEAAKQPESSHLDVLIALAHAHAALEDRQSAVNAARAAKELAERLVEIDEQTVQTINNLINRNETNEPGDRKPDGA